ncbi:MAG: sugar phosphate nucleotidyltransferase [Candidatus Omnitrophica bacterium]|nr:sugar phosphate nucleotidyltransferase [Candidatus Omnitrophota bacterium]
MEKFFKEDLKCVVLCAGKGLRLNEPDLPKSMILIKNKPILYYIIDYWKNITDKFIFVVGYKKEKIIEYVKTLNIKSEFVEQKELKGIGHAVSLVEDYVNKKFIVVLGDCLCKGNFIFPKNMKQGIGVWKTDNPEDIKKSYSVEIKNKKVIKVVEKPKHIVNNLCGMGFYFFDRVVFDYIKITPPSPLRNEIEITDVIQKMIDGGEFISPVIFEGFYININFREDIDICEKYF